jgi:hypothetical protein
MAEALTADFTRIVTVIVIHGRPGARLQRDRVKPIRYRQRAFPGGAGRHTPSVRPLSLSAFRKRVTTLEPRF